MLFNSYVFIFVFLPYSIAVFYATRRIGNGDLALAANVLSSLIFYAYWRADYVPILLTSIIINYLLGTAITRGYAKLPLLTVGLALNLSFLGYFKYANFLVSQIDMLGAQVPLPNISLPLAVSFYTFQQVAYLVDCYRGKLKRSRFIEYLFTVTFFPHLIAGPIVRMREILPQFDTFVQKPFLSNVALGLALFVIGLAKKVIIADYFGRLSDPLFSTVSSSHTMLFWDAWGASLAYTLQIYFDFSGYSDMAIGLSRMFGFRLAVNFLSPYQALSITDFWRRWHITLSRFLRDYLYIPLGGNRHGQIRTYINLLLTMTLGGLWHGASWTFVVWGLYHGILLALHRLWRHFNPSLVLPSPVNAGLTFFSVVIGWVLFRSHDFRSAADMLMAMWAMPLNAGTTIPGTAWLTIAIALTFCWLSPNVYQVFARFRPALILRGQLPMLHTKLSPYYSFGFRATEAFAISAMLVASLFEMRGVVSRFLYFMF